MLNLLLCAFSLAIEQIILVSGAAQLALVVLFDAFVLAADHILLGALPLVADSKLLVLLYTLSLTAAKLILFILVTLLLAWVLLEVLTIFL